MTKYEELNELYENMFTCNTEEAKNAESYEFRKLRQEYLDDILDSHLTHEQLELVEEILVEVYLNAERDARILYQQGIRDGVWMLKQLRVLA